jgi:DNA invertase Pin-like site-specific DNA recombinase
MTEPIKAAQYLRMSTERQQYSLENQSAAIQLYAASHGFEIVQTYSDAAKSGVVLKNRTGLRRLLQDVVSGNQSFQAILVYDVSRWGRFQDTDESAHYEFLCKSAGVPVHYCAETFSNDGALPSLIMKALKRTTAGEYSRELGIKVLAGQKRLARLGFKIGGRAGYGLRRMLVSPDRSPKQPLAFGERKSLASDHVVYVHGPSDEEETVRSIFQMLISERRRVSAIARELNRRKIPYLGDTKWDYTAVYNILRHPKYTGSVVFNRTSAKLYTPQLKLPKSEWVVTSDAFEPIIDKVTFEKAQKILDARTNKKSDEELLNGLRELLASEGRLSKDLIDHAPTPNVPRFSAYRSRFGSLRNIYDLIGYGADFGAIDTRRRKDMRRRELLRQIAATFPSEISIF